MTNDEYMVICHKIIHSMGLQVHSWEDNITPIITHLPDSALGYIIGPLDGTTVWSEKWKEAASLEVAERVLLNRRVDDPV